MWPTRPQRDQTLLTTDLDYSPQPSQIIGLDIDVLYIIGGESNLSADGYNKKRRRKL